MFKKFKEKLRSSLSLFSRDAVEESESVDTSKTSVQAGRSQKENDVDLTEKMEAEQIEDVAEAKVPSAQELIEEASAETASTEEINEVDKDVTAVEEPAVTKSLLAKAKEVFTVKKLSEKKFENLFSNLENSLLENNVAVSVINKIKSDLKLKLVDRPLPRDLQAVVTNTLNASITEVIMAEKMDLITLAKSKRPYVLAFFGINGSGKTTTIAKVANLFQRNNLSCVMAAGDTFRAAAIQQLEEHANKLKIKIIKHDYGADAAAVAFDAVKHAEKHSLDVVLIDTAGRLHSDTNLMDELKKIVRVAKPDLKIFVGESITGNDCIEQADKFNQHVGIDAIVLTKSDVDEKGGTALSISFVTKKPILFIGTGQDYSDLQPFTKEFVLENLGLT